MNVKFINVDSAIRTATTLARAMNCDQYIIQVGTMYGIFTAIRGKATILYTITPSGEIK